MIRRVLDSDFAQLVEIYTEAVRQTANTIYTPEQIDAWSAFPAKTEKFRQFVFGPETYATVVENSPVAFCGLGNDGHIASLYVHPDYNRMGYASKLLQYVMEGGERRGMRRFYTEASFLSKTVFERHGFVVDCVEEVDYDGVLFRRFKMVRLVEAYRH
jgi:putative acetyltransferase